MSDPDAPTVPVPTPKPALQLRRWVHELNSPLGVSAMAASLLPAQMDGIVAALDAQSRDRVAGLLDEWRETAALLQSGLQFCVQILDSTGAANGSSAGLLPLSDLQTTLQSAVSISLARRPDLQTQCLMQFARPVQLRLDTVAWQQVIANLVGNSLQHGFSRRGHGTIRISGTSLPGQRALVHYYDDGVGISHKTYQRMFEDGFSTRAGQGGNGLGMGIVRDLVEHKLGGRIQVHRPAKGVHISIETPC